jgi:hypothetical protein
VHPAQIDRKAARRALVATAMGKADSLRRSLRFYDKLIAAQKAHPGLAGLLPAEPIGPIPTLRDTALDWSAFEPAFQEAVEAAVERAISGGSKRRGASRQLGQDPITAARAHRSKGGKTIRNPNAAHRGYVGTLSWLVRHAWSGREEAVRTLHGVDDLFDLQVIARAIDAYIARAEADDALLDAEETSTGATQLARLATLAERNGMSVAVRRATLVAQLNETIDNRQDCEMSATRRKFLRLLEADPAIARAILTAPRTLMKAARRGLADWEKLGVNERIKLLKLGAAAAMIELQLARPLRTSNVHQLTVGDGAELRRPRRAGAAAQVLIDRRRVKNCKDIEHALLSRGADTEVRHFLYRWTPLLGAANYGGLEVVKLLVETGADIEARDNAGRTVLREAATPRAWAAAGGPSVVECLASQGADPREPATGRSILGNVIARYSADPDGPEITIDIYPREHFAARLAPLEDKDAALAKAAELSPSGAAAVTDRLVVISESRHGQEELERLAASLDGLSHSCANTASAI